MIGLGSIPGAERDIVRVRKWALLSAVGWPPRCLVGRVFVRGIVLVCAPLDVHGWRGRVRVPLPRYGSLAQWMGRPVTSREVVGSSPTRPTEHGMFPRCCHALLVVAYVTVWARVVSLRASRWRVILCSCSCQSSSGTGWL